MTSIPLSALPGPHEDTTRRDRWGRYLVKPKGADKPTGYTRVTTAAKALDDGGGLAPWKATAACVGSVVRRGLRSQWEVLLGAYGPSPWYAGQAAKARCKALVEECAAAGGATERRDVGTSLHALTALLDVGRPPEHLTVETERDLDGYRKTLAEAGVEIVEGMVEVTVVLDDCRVAGTFDRLVSVPGFERPLVADLKTGVDLSYSWQSIAVQLAFYSRGDDIYRQGPAPDGSEDERLAMPTVDQENGLVIWLDAGTGNCELHLVDLSAGWEAAELSLAARAWRKAVVSMPFAPGERWRRAPAEDDELRAKLEASIAAYDPAANIIGSPENDELIDGLMAQQSAPAGDGPGEGEASTSPGAVAIEQIDVDLGLVDDARAEVQGEDFTTALRAWLQSWIDLIGKHPQAVTDLRRSWPLGIPTLRRSDDHTPEQLAAIEAALKAVTKRHVITWPEPRPEPADGEAMIYHMFPGTEDTTKEQ